MQDPGFSKVLDSPVVAWQHYGDQFLFSISFALQIKDVLFRQTSPTGMRLFIFELLQSLSWIWWKKVKLLSLMSPRSLNIFPNESVVRCQRRGHANICKTVRVSASVACVCRVTDAETTCMKRKWGRRRGCMRESERSVYIRESKKGCVSEKERIWRREKKCVNNLIQPKT